MNERGRIYTRDGDDLKFVHHIETFTINNPKGRLDRTVIRVMCVDGTTCDIELGKRIAVQLRNELNEICKEWDEEIEKEIAKEREERDQMWEDFKVSDKELKKLWGRKKKWEELK